MTDKPKDSDAPEGKPLPPASVTPKAGDNAGVLRANSSPKPAQAAPAPKAATQAAGSGSTAISPKDEQATRSPLGVGGPGGFISASQQAASSKPAKIGDESAKHYGEAGPGAEEVGQDTTVKPGKAVGAQLQPAVMTPQGSLPHDQVATPSGLQPAAAVADSTLAAKAVEARNRAVAAGNLRAHKNGRRRLSQEQIDRMNPAELRAVASDRGYEGVEGGRIAIRQKFAAAQEEDESLEEADSQQTTAEELDKANVEKE